MKKATIILGIMLMAGVGLAGCKSTYKLESGKMVQRAIVYMNFGEYEQAINTLRASLEVEYENPATHYWLGRCYELTTNTRQGIDEYRLAVRFNPAMEAAQMALIMALHQSRQEDESILATQEYLKHRAGLAGDVIQLAQDFLSKGMDKQAILAFERAQELSPTDPTPLMALANYYKSKGDQENEKEAVRRAAIIGPYYAGLAQRAGSQGIKVESPQPKPYPKTSDLDKALRDIK